MNKPLATLGLIAVTGALSVAHAAAVQPHPQAPAQAPTQAATPRTVKLAVKGMTCGGCVLGTRKVLTRLPGVAKADVSYENGTAVVTYDPRKVTVEQMVTAIKTLGYTATLAATAEAPVMGRQP